MRPEGAAQHCHGAILMPEIGCTHMACQRLCIKLNAIARHMQATFAA